MVFDGLMRDLLFGQALSAGMVSVVVTSSPLVAVAGTAHTANIWVVRRDLTVKLD